MYSWFVTNRFGVSNCTYVSILNEIAQFSSSRCHKFFLIDWRQKTMYQYNLTISNVKMKYKLYKKGKRCKQKKLFIKIHRIENECEFT